jgi:hypothetical protein
MDNEEQAAASNCTHPHTHSAVNSATVKSHDQWIVQLQLLKREAPVSHPMYAMCSNNYIVIIIGTSPPPKKGT